MALLGVDDVEHFHRAGCRDIFMGAHIVVRGKYDLHLNHGTLLESLEHRVVVVSPAIQIASLGCSLFNRTEEFRDRGSLLMASVSQRTTFIAPVSKHTCIENITWC